MITTKQANSILNLVLDAIGVYPNSTTFNRYEIIAKIKKEVGK